MRLHSEELPRIATKRVVRAEEAICHDNAESSERILSKTEVNT